MKSALKLALARLWERTLKPEGFSYRSTGNYYCRFPDVLQCIEIFQHRDVFSLRIYLRYLGTPVELEHGFDFSQSLKNFLAGGPAWFETKTASEIESGVAEIEKALVEEVLPFLARFRSIESVVMAVEAGEVSDDFFGVDPIRRRINHAVCLEALGRDDAARDRFKDAVEESKKYERIPGKRKEWLDLAYARLGLPSE